MTGVLSRQCTLLLPPNDVFGELLLSYCFFLKGKNTNKYEKGKKERQKKKKKRTEEDRANVWKCFALAFEALFFFFLLFCHYFFFLSFAEAPCAEFH